MMIKHAEFVILGAVVLVAAVGLFTTFTDSGNDFDAWGRGGAYEEDAASFPDFNPLTKGKSRRWAADEASFPEFNPLTNYELRARRKAFKGDAGVIWEVNQAIDEDTFQTKRSKRYFKGDAG